MKLKLLWAIPLILIMVGQAHADHPVTVASPLSGSTIFNFSINLDVSSNKTIDEWNYSLNGGANITFTPNVTFLAQQGNNTLIVYAKNTSTVNSTTINFTSAYILVIILDDESGTNISSGIAVKLLNADSLVTLTDNTTNVSGQTFIKASAYGTYRIQAGGPADKDWNILRSFEFLFDVPTENITLRLVKSGTGAWATIQNVDAYYGINLENVDVVWKKENLVVDQQTSDSSGFITQYLVPNTFYTTTHTLTNYITTEVTRTYVSGVYVTYLPRQTLDIIQEPDVVAITYPTRRVLYRNSTASFAIDIFGNKGDLEEYGIVIGTNPQKIVDDDVPVGYLGKRVMAIGNNPDGEFLFSTEGIELKNWKANELYAGFYWIRGGVKTWRIMTYSFDAATDQSPYAIDLQAVLEENAMGLGFKNTGLAVTLFFLLLTGIMTGGAASRKGKAFGVMAMFMCLGTFIFYGFLDKWMIIPPILITLSLLIGRYGGLYE